MFCSFLGQGSGWQPLPFALYLLAWLCLLFGLLITASVTLAFILAHTWQLSQLSSACKKALGWQGLPFISILSPLFSASFRQVRPCALANWQGVSSHWARLSRVHFSAICSLGWVALWLGAAGRAWLAVFAWLGSAALTAGCTVGLAGCGAGCGCTGCAAWLADSWIAGVAAAFGCGLASAACGCCCGLASAASWLWLWLGFGCLWLGFGFSGLAALCAWIAKASSSALANSLPINPAAARGAWWHWFPRFP